MIEFNKMISTKRMPNEIFILFKKTIYRRKSLHFKKQKPSLRKMAFYSLIVLMRYF